MLEIMQIAQSLSSTVVANLYYQTLSFSKVTNIVRILEKSFLDCVPQFLKFGLGEDRHSVNKLNP